MTTDTTRWWRRVLVGGHGELVAKRAAASEEYVVLPSRRSPRSVVDARASQAAEDLLSRSVTQRGAPEFLGPVLARLATLVGPRWSVSADPGHETLREHLEGILGTEVHIAIVVGPPRVNRKPVVRCYSGSELVAVAKLGPDPHTAVLVDNEAAWLARLQDDPIEGVVTPAPLHHGEYGGSAVLVMAPLPIEDDGGVQFDEMPFEMLAAFTERHRRPAGTGLASSTWFRGLAERAGSADDVVLAEARAHYLAADPPVELEAWHGDWSPWNLGRTPDGVWCLWDWERAAVDVPRGFDCVHRHHHYGNGFDAARTELQSIGLTSGLIEATIGLYRIELATRLIEGNRWSTGPDNEIRRDLAAGIETLTSPGDGS